MTVTPVFFFYTFSYQCQHILEPLKRRIVLLYKHCCKYFITKAYTIVRLIFKTIIACIIKKCVVNMFLKKILLINSATLFNTFLVKRKISTLKLRK